MSAPSRWTPTYEIVRTDAGWHVRFRAANRQIVWTTEVYKRRASAINAIESINAIHSCWIDTHSDYDRKAKVWHAGLVERADSWNKINRTIAKIRDVDERTA